MSDYADSVRDERREWLSQWDACMYCGKRGPLECHEIERRSHAKDRWWHPCGALALCGPCHQGPFAAMDHARQLAVKFCAADGSFDLAEWLLIGDPTGRAPHRVTLAEIAGYLELKQEYKP